MSISVNTPKTSEKLKTGKNSVKFTYRGSVDKTSENDVEVTVTIPDDDPLVFDDNKKKVISYNHKFPSPKNGDLQKTLAIKLEKGTTDGTPSILTFIFKAKSGEEAPRDVSIIY